MVSEKHLKLRIFRGQVPVLEDLDSTNGTRVNGKKVKNTELKDGDEIQIGLTTLKFHLDPRKFEEGFLK